ncbi:MAG: DDE-type integrase/transposase/recombinase [Oxalobacter sp.]|nr:DDE-type integrase/transposase/recombinase [Oxalobacter sp.]
MIRRPEEVWVADITYIPTRERFVYLSLLTDAYSRKIVGYHVHPTLQTEEVAVAFKRAPKQRKSNLPLDIPKNRSRKTFIAAPAKR